jgi:CHAD domain-containing protein
MVHGSCYRLPATNYRLMSGSESLILQRLRALSRQLPAAQQGNVHAIHQARVATRRLREALPLVVDGPGGRKLERKVRALTQALGPVRELDVVLHTLDALEDAEDVPRRGIDCLRRLVSDQRRRRHAEMRRQVADCDLSKLRKKAVAGARKHDAAVARAVARGDRPAARRGADPVRVAAADRRAGRRAERLRLAIENAAGIYLPDRLHEIRIAVKKLRYAMEVARDLRASRATVRINTLKRAQDLLGRMHDLEVLIARTRAVQGSPGASDLRLSSDLDRLVRRLENECRRLHVRYIESRPALLAICDHMRAASAHHDESAA